MAEKDPRDVIAVVRRSIEVSPRRSRRLRFHRLRGLFGFQMWSSERKELISRLLDEQGIVAQPSLSQADLNDWVLLTIPDRPPIGHGHPVPPPSAEWFAHLRSLRPDSEREVEMHFISPLFLALGYDEDQEAAGFRFDLWEGVHHRNVEADLVYFADSRHSIEDGEPLVLVECKSPTHDFDAGVGQARSYSFWVVPAYYVTTNGRVVVVYNYQGGKTPDLKVIEVETKDLEARFDDLYNIVGHDAALAARRAKAETLTRRAEH